MHLPPSQRLTFSNKANAPEMILPKCATSHVMMQQPRRLRVLVFLLERLVGGWLGVLGAKLGAAYKGRATMARLRLVLGDKAHVGMASNVLRK